MLKSKLWIGILLVAVLSWLLAPISWWIFVIPSFAVPFLLQTGPTRGFVLAAVGVTLATVVLVLPIHLSNHGILADRIGRVLGDLPGLALLLICVLVPALLGGIFGCAAGYLRPPVDLVSST